MFPGDVRLGCQHWNQLPAPISVRREQGLRSFDRVRSLVFRVLRFFLGWPLSVSVLTAWSHCIPAAFASGTKFGILFNGILAVTY